MNVDQALHVAHIINRRFGTHHCGEPECEMCAVRTLADEVRRQQHEITGLRNLVSARPKAKPANTCPHCASNRVDGICAECDT